MAQSRLKQRAWQPVVGVATAATTIVAGWTPFAQAAPTTQTRDTGLKSHAADPSDGTFESCGAYFGYGKQEYNVLDVVDFDVADQNGADGASHAVDDDTQVVLVLTNEEGDTLECTPVEVTEAQWDEAMGSLYIDGSAEHPLPAWPGPGHYIYPSVNFGPSIDGFGTIVSAGFRVTTIPNGHTLVSPSGVKPLTVHYPFGWDGWSDVIDPNVVALITEQAGAAAASAWTSTLPQCEDGDPNTTESNFAAAVNVLSDYRGYGVIDPDNVDCSDAESLNAEVSFQLSLESTTTYTEPIVLALPEPPTGPTTTTTPSGSAPQAVAAQPVAATPTYTG